MSDYEILEQFIIDSDYEVKTSVENLIVMCFLNYDGYVEDEGSYIKELELEYVEDCIEFIKENGLGEFDYYC